MPARWDGSPLRRSELTPPAKERSEPTGLRFGSPETAPRAAARIARTLECRFEQEGQVWVTSSPELITITPEPAGGSLVTVELTTHPWHLTTVLTAIGLTCLGPGHLAHPFGGESEDGSDGTIRERPNWD